MFHAKGDKYGPVDLDDYWTKDLGFSKTQAVVLDLLKQQGISNDNWHIVWLDNLFTSAWLLTILRELGFGAAGIVRTTKTKRERVGRKEQRTRLKKNKNKIIAGWIRTSETSN